jgi:site-specific recombinase XerD
VFAIPVSHMQIEDEAIHPAQWTTWHTSRYFFAPDLPESGYDIRTVQELLGNKNIRTAMNYTHVFSRGPADVRSPVDTL